MNLWNITDFEENTAIIATGGTTCSYRELDDCQKQLAMQIEKHSLVLLAMENEPESLIGYISCLANDYVAFLLPEECTKDTFWKQINTYLPDYIWISKKKWEQWKGKEKRNFKKCFSLMKYILLRRKETREEVLHPDLSVLLPAPDSHDSSRTVRLSRKNVIAGASQLCEQWQLTQGDRTFLSFSDNYFYALSIVHALLLCGGSIVFTEKNMEPQLFSQLVEDYKITLVWGTSQTLAYMKNDVSHSMAQKVRLFVKMQELMPDSAADISDAFDEEEKAKFFFLSACSEPATWISSLSAKDRQTKQESRGTALPDSELVIIDEFSNTVFDARREGEIVSVGGHVSMGFANDYQALSEEDRNSAILYTGISGYLDEDGYLYVTGRK